MKRLFRGVILDLLGGRRDVFDWRQNKVGLRVKQDVKVHFLLTDGKLGDSLLISSMIASIRSCYPDCYIAVWACASNGAYWKSHPEIDAILVVPDRHSRSVWSWLLGVRQFVRRFRKDIDICLSFDRFANLDTLILLKWLGAETIVGLNKAQYQLFDYSIEELSYWPQWQHISIRNARFLDLFNVPEAMRGRPPYVPCKVLPDVQAEAGISMCEDGIVVYFNTYGASASRSFTRDSICRIIHVVLSVLPLACIVVTTKTSCEREHLEDVLSSLGVASRVTVVESFPTVEDLFAEVQKASLVITPDTAVGHIAAALAKKMIVFYSSRWFETVWHPSGGYQRAIVNVDGEDINSFEDQSVREALVSCISSAQPV